MGCVVVVKRGMVGCEVVVKRGMVGCMVVVRRGNSGMCGGGQKREWYGGM